MIRTRLFAGTALALMAVLAMPSPANAESTTQAPYCTMTPARVQLNRAATFDCKAGTFGAAERVRFTLAGVNGAEVPVVLPADAAVAVNGSSATTVRQADARGATGIRVRALPNATGTLRITASGASRTITSLLPVLSAEGGAGRADSAPPAGLAPAGSRADTVFRWVVAIIVVFAAAAYLSDRGGVRGRGGGVGRSDAAEI